MGEPSFPVPIVASGLPPKQGYSQLCSSLLLLHRTAQQVLDSIAQRVDEEAEAVRDVSRRVAAAKEQVRLLSARAQASAVDDGGDGRGADAQLLPTLRPPLLYPEESVPARSACAPLLLSLADSPPRAAAADAQAPWRVREPEAAGGDGDEDGDGDGANLIEERKRGAVAVRPLRGTAGNMHGCEDEEEEARGFTAAPQLLAFFYGSSDWPRLQSEPSLHVPSAGAYMEGSRARPHSAEAYPAHVARAWPSSSMLAPPLHSSDMHTVHVEEHSATAARLARDGAAGAGARKLGGQNTTGGTSRHGDVDLDATSLLLLQSLEPLEDERSALSYRPTLNPMLPVLPVLPRALRPRMTMAPLSHGFVHLTGAAEAQQPPAATAMGSSSRLPITTPSPHHDLTATAGGGGGAAAVAASTTAAVVGEPTSAWAGAPVVPFLTQDHGPARSAPNTLLLDGASGAQAFGGGSGSISDGGAAAAVGADPEPVAAASGPPVQEEAQKREKLMREMTALLSMRRLALDNASAAAPPTPSSKSSTASASASAPANGSGSGGGQAFIATAASAAAAAAAAAATADAPRGSDEAAFERSGDAEGWPKKDSSKTASGGSTAQRPPQWQRQQDIVMPIKRLDEFIAKRVAARQPGGRRVRTASATAASAAAAAVAAEAAESDEECEQDSDWSDE